MDTATLQVITVYVVALAVLAVAAGLVNYWDDRRAPKEI